MSGEASQWSKVIRDSGKEHARRREDQYQWAVEYIRQFEQNLHMSEFPLDDLTKKEVIELAYAMEVIHERYYPYVFQNL